MLEDMIKLIDRTFVNRPQNKEETFDIIAKSCEEIFRRYILLILNERNYHDAEIIRDIENSEVIIPKHGEIKPEFCLYTLVNNSARTEEVIDYIKENSIIIKKNKDVLNEFYDLMKVKDSLMNKDSRYLTRRIILQTNSFKQARLINKLDEFKTSKLSQLRIRR